MQKTQGVLTDADLEAMRIRNAERAAQAVKQMGNRYVCHPANIMKKDPQRANFTPARIEPTQGVLPLRWRAGK
jgi:hypothetical protein